MKRSLLYQVGAAEAVDFEALSEEVELAERLDLDTVWCFPAAGSDGQFRDSAASIWLSALATRTERIRLGWGLAAMTPPERPPMRVAEQAAAIDLASKGRLEVGMLPDGDLTDQAEGGWDEGLRMLVDMWDAPSFSWTSERFIVHPLDVVPKPIQKPHPPVWLAGWSAEHAIQAGGAGLAFLDLSGAPDETLVLHRDAYTEARTGADPDDLVSIGVYGIAVDLEPSAENAGRLLAWEELGFDHVVARAGPLEGGHAETKERIRFLASEDARVH
jgi:alkanesulfonate monooxygenase SsuD/methylene tetrahydromethanopterin reductase-like flavin-dependent oxidoreductase (luciferase family)